MDSINNLHISADPFIPSKTKYINCQLRTRPSPALFASDRFYAKNYSNTHILYNNPRVAAVFYVQVQFILFPKRAPKDENCDEETGTRSEIALGTIYTKLEIMNAITWNVWHWGNSSENKYK